MEEISAYVRSKGMKFGAWLEPEFAMVNTQWLREHPDWFHAAGTRQNLFYGTRRFTDHLLKLERADVRQFLADFMVKWVERYHLEWMRWDFNDGPAPFWEANETAEADCGRLQVGFGEGLLTVLDDVMRRCPQLRIEACAGGGHRMDLGTLRRAHAAWMNDNSYSIEAIRCYAKGVNTILTGCFADSAFLWQSQTYCPQSKEDFQKNGYSRHLLRSRMAGSLLFAEVSTVVTPAMKEFLKREIALYKQMRPFLMKDYYPLFQPRTLAEYDGWQFHDPETGEGWALIFRVQAPQATVRLRLHGLNPRRRYRIEDVDRGTVRTVKGGSALTLRVPERNGTAWLHYKP
jgi:alpha-galactosidase